MLDNKASHKFITISSRLPNPAPAMLVCLSCCSDEQNTAIAAILTTSLSRQLPKHRAAGPAAAAQRPASQHASGRPERSRARQRPRLAQFSSWHRVHPSPGLGPGWIATRHSTPPAPRAVSRLARSGRAGLRVAAKRPPARPPDLDGSAPHPSRGLQVASGRRRRLQFEHHLTTV